MQRFQTSVSDKLKEIQKATTPSTMDTSEGAVKPKAKKKAKGPAPKFFATPGICTTWSEAKAQFNQYPLSQVQTFKSEATVERHSSSDEGTAANNNNSVEEVFPAKRAKPTPPGHHGNRQGSTERVGNVPSRLLPPAPLPPAAPAAPTFTAAIRDTSVGTDNKVFGVELNIERKVLTELCPAGISLEMQRELADAAVDAASLPGTYAIYPVDAGGTEDVLASLTEAVLGAETAGTRAVDTSWQKRDKTAMVGVKTAADLGVAVEELSEVMDPVLEQMENHVCNTLDVLCWDDDQVEAYLVSGRLPLLSWWMVQLYHELLLSFVQGVSKHGWDLVRIDRVFYFTRALVNLRAMARRRFPFILRTYVFLRDPRHEGWTPRTKIGKGAHHLHE
jgi:hypothetical protein